MWYVCLMDNNPTTKLDLPTVPCVLVATLADLDPHTLLRYEFRNGSEECWQPAAIAVHTIDPGWPVHVRLKP